MRVAGVIVRAVGIAVIRAANVVVRAANVVVRAVGIAVIRAADVIVRAVCIAVIRAADVVVRAVCIAVMRMMHATCRLGMLIEHRAGIAVYGRIHTTMGAHTGSMPMRVSGRCCHAVAMVRVMPMPMVPRRGSPARHKAQRREGCYRKDGYAGFRIAIHGAPVGITENGEAIGIIAGIGPRHTRVVSIRGYAIGPVGAIIPIRRDNA